MKGMLDFLEKAGLVKSDTPAAPTPAASTGRAIETPTQVAPVALPVGDTQTGQVLDLEGIYANGGVVPSIYPAERLLRLLDGLSAMDEATRLMAIQAMDAADESWSIQDPLTDAAAKISALSAYSEALLSKLQTEQENTQVSLDAIATRTEQAVGGIRKQIAELEALATREQSRAMQESSDQQSKLNAIRAQTVREVSDMNAQRVRLQGLAALFQNNPTSPTKD